MEKYGVEQDVRKTVNGPKTAQEKDARCPSCGGELRPQKDTGVLLCFRCGSKPYEV